MRAPQALCEAAPPLGQFWQGLKDTKHIFVASGQLFFLLVGDQVARTGRALYPRTFIHTTGKGCAALTPKMCLNPIKQHIQGEMMMNLNKLTLRN